MKCNDQMTIYKELSVRCFGVSRTPKNPWHYHYVRQLWQYWINNWIVKQSIKYNVRCLYAFITQADLEMIHGLPIIREETSLQIQHLELLNFGLLLHCTKKTEQTKKKTFLRNNTLVLVLEIFAVTFSIKSVCLRFTGILENISTDVLH